jgi:Trypsin-like peptidase domain
MPFSLDQIEAATVLVGAVKAATGATTFGTGFIAEHRGKLYVVTCKHVILEANATSFFAIPRPQKTKSPPGGYSVLTLGRPVYHPKDGPTGTYDVAVLKILHDVGKKLRTLGIVPITFDPAGEEPTDGLAVVGAGYPVDYVESELRSGKLEPLRTVWVDGTVKNLPLDNLTQAGFGAALREGFFAHTIEAPLGKGASGGTVQVNADGPSARIVGVLLGSANIQIKKNGRTEDVTGFFFASSQRILEALR